MTRAAISVVTIAWRNEVFAPAFAASLLAAAARAGGPPPELVVVANGADGRAAADAVVDACLDTVLCPVVVHLDRNTGFSGGADAGVENTAGDVVVVANLDLTFDQSFLDVVAREAAESEWDLLAPSVVQGPERLEKGASRRKRAHRVLWVSPPPPAGAAVPGGNGACVVLRRATLERRVAAAGALFDPEFHSFNEDIDLFWWAERAGLVVRYSPDARVEHALAGSFGGRHRFEERPVDVQRRVMANYRVTVWKNASGTADWLGWLLGETQYLGQAVRSRRGRGVRDYAASWKLAVATARAIRRRSGCLRPPILPGDRG